MKINYMNQIETIERKITGLMFQIKKGEITMAESKIGKQFSKLKPLDLASYENLLKEYKKIVEEVKLRETIQENKESQSN
jgi:hypothetical protein